MASIIKPNDRATEIVIEELKQRIIDLPGTITDFDMFAEIFINFLTQAKNNNWLISVINNDDTLLLFQHRK